VGATCGDNATGIYVAAYRRQTLADCTGQRRHVPAGGRAVAPAAVGLDRMVVMRPPPEADRMLRRHRTTHHGSDLFETHPGRQVVTTSPGSTVTVNEMLDRLQTSAG
jgi:hypothetical protein